MSLVKYQLRQGENRTLTEYQIIVCRRYGADVYCYIDAKTGAEIFKGKYFECAGPFVNGFALVAKRGRYYHINTEGKAAYRWRFSDVGPVVRDDGTVMVQHSRAFGWSRFNVLSGQFISNPPRYRR